MLGRVFTLCSKRTTPHTKNPLINLSFFCIAEAPTELSITDKAEDLEIGKPTKVRLFFFFFPSERQTFSSPPAATNQGKSLT